MCLYTSYSNTFLLVIWVSAHDVPGSTNPKHFSLVKIRSGEDWSCSVAQMNVFGVLRKVNNPPKNRDIRTSTDTQNLFSKVTLTVNVIQQEPFAWFCLGLCFNTVNESDLFLVLCSLNKESLRDVPEIQRLTVTCSCCERSSCDRSQFHLHKKSRSFTLVCGRRTETSSAPTFSST